MFLVTAATDFEMEPFAAAYQGREKPFQLITGIGPLETAVRLYGWLAHNADRVRVVINFGVAGAYLQPPGTRQPQLLDICLASEEVLGDLGICQVDGIEPISGTGLEVIDRFALDAELLRFAEQTLQNQDLEYYTGPFVTVNCSSGTAERGAMLAGRFRGLCENMEGAAVARVCGEFDLPCLEVRCISNMVEDRDTTRWQLKKACRVAGEVSARVTEYLQEKLELSSAGEK